MQEAAAIERACVQFQTANAAERTAAEAVIHGFRNLDNPYQLCQYLLTHSTQPLVHFHALSVIRDAILREWSSLSKEFIVQMRDYLMRYSSPSYRPLVYQTLALISKRGWWDQTTKDSPYIDQAPFFNYISELMNSNDLGLLSTGVGLLQQTVIEFSTSSKSFQMQLSWEYHLHCQKSFEATKLADIFVFLVTLLRKVASAISPSSPPTQELVTLLDNILQVIIEVLDWRFNQTAIEYLTTTYKSINTTSVAPGASWRPLLVESTDLRDILFNLYPYVRKAPTISHTVRYVILLLCSVNGPIFTNQAVKAEYMTHLLKGIMHLLTTVTQLQNSEDMLELGGFSQILQRFVSNFKLETLGTLPFDALRAFLMEYVRITTLSLQGLRASVAGGDEDLEGELEVESFDLLLEGWVSLGHDTEKIMRQHNTNTLNLPLYMQDGSLRILAECAGHLFSLYVTTRLEMARTGLARETDDDDEDQPDKVKYDSQLAGVACLGRLEPVTATSTLAKHLNERVSALSQGKQEDSILEEVHWLVLIAGYLLADEGDGEVPQVPYFVNIASVIAANTAGSEDGVIALTTAVMRVAELENQAQKSQRTLSPLLGDTLIWFLTRWSKSYLLLQPASRIQYSPSLLNAYGSAQGAGGLVVLDAILLKAALNFYASRAETELMLATCQLLNVLSKTQAPKYLHLLKERDAWPILIAAWRDLKGSLAASVLGNLVSALVTFSVLAGGDLAKQLLADIAVPLEARLAPLRAPNTQTTLSISESLCVLQGVCKAGGGAAAEWVMGAVSVYGPILPNVISAFSIHADLVKIALSVFSDFADVQLENIQEAQVSAYYDMMRAAFQAYAREVAATPVKSQAELRERYKCAKVIFHTLSTLSSASPAGPSAKTTHAIFDGLAAMLPFLAGNQGAELLQFPKLCRLFFMTVNHVITELPLALTGLPTNLYHTLLQALQFGVSHHDLAISRNSMEAITAIAIAHRDNPNTLSGPGNTVADILAHFLESVLKILLYGESSVDDILTPTAGALYPLIQCIPDRYPIAVQSLLATTTPAVRERLLAAFRALPVPQRGDESSSSEARFCEALNTFVGNARGFLRAR